MERISASLGMINVKEKLIYLEGVGADTVCRMGKYLAGAKVVIAEGKGKRKKIFHAYQRCTETRGHSTFCRRIVFKKKEREKILLH